MTTTTVVAGADGGCLVIDPAVTVAELDALASWLSARGLRPVAGWSTHPHWDHVLWSGSLGDGVVRYATPRAVEVAARELPGLVSGMEEAAPGHDLALFARLAPLAEPEIPWRGPRAAVLAHDAHAPGHGAVFLPDTGVLVAGDMCSDTEIPLLGRAGRDRPVRPVPARARRAGGRPRRAGGGARARPRRRRRGVPAAGRRGLRLPGRDPGGPGPGWTSGSRRPRPGCLPSTDRQRALGY